MILTVLSALPLGIWTYLLTSRGSFWKMNVRLTPTSTSSSRADRKVVAVIPARNEADVIGSAIESLLTQDLPVPLDLVLIDDASDDGTAETACAVASHLDRSEQLTVMRGQPLPPRWTGKLWAVAQGVALAQEASPDYLLLTDADIRHAPGSIRRLLELAEPRQFQLASLMVRLKTETLAERLLIPAFVYFFFQLYPPVWVARVASQTAAAAGGCMLIRSSTLKAIGGIASISQEVIDDCALARAVKRRGHSIWMGLATDTVSLRSYGGFPGVGRMISRSAFYQLRHSPTLLVLTLLALGVTYVLPPLLLLSHRKERRVLGATAFLLMAISYRPIVAEYNRSTFAALSLPLAAVFYAGATIHSAICFWLGIGGQWKGRIQDTRG